MVDSSVVVKLKLPRIVVDLVSPRNLEYEARILIALELYREKRVSLGKAAEIAGLSIREFLYELRTRGIPLNYDVDELEEDFRVIRELRGLMRK